MSNEELGVTWFNQPAAERADWLARADSATPADACARFQRDTAQSVDAAQPAPTNGGRRPGAGRKKVEARKVSISITLATEDADLAREAGRGNASEGVRVALNLLREREKFLQSELHRV